MSLTKSYPLPRPIPITGQESVEVQDPAASPSGTLVAQLTLSNLIRDKPAIVATHFNSGNYLVISSVTVTGGNPPASSVIPALQVSYAYDGASGANSNTVAGINCQGSSVVDGFNITQSVSFSHNGEGVISAGTVGGQYTGGTDSSPLWDYTATISIYRQ